MSNKNNRNNDLLAAGQALAKRREKLGLDPTECADALKITVSKLTAIETGDKSKFNTELFLKGYLKNYAKLVNISEEEILHLYNVAQVDDVVDADLDNPKPKVSKWWLPYVAGIMIIVGWFMASDNLDINPQSHDNVVATEKKTLESVSSVKAPEDQLGQVSTESMSIASDTSQDAEQQTPQEQQLSPSPSINEGEAVAEQLAQLETPAPQIQAATENAQLVANASGGEISSAGVDNAGVDSAEENSPAVNITEINNVPASELVENSQPQRVDVAPQPVIGTDKDTLSFVFSDECWVNVVDADDEVLVSRLYAKGDTVTVGGKGPFEVILGNVNGVSLSLNGQPVTLTPNGLNRILRLTLGE